LDVISLVNEDCGHHTLDEEDSFDNVDLSNHPDNVATPSVGMQFDTAEYIKTFYKRHGVKYSFGVRIRT